MKTGPSYRYKLAGTKPRRKTGHDMFDNTIQKTQVWLNDLMSELDWEDKPHKAYMALRTVLDALRGPADCRGSHSIGSAATDADPGFLLRRLESQG